MAGLGAALAATSAGAIVPNNNNNRNTPPTLNQGVNGVGQMILPIYNATGTNASIGVCTGTLINPRTVIFAAHCVNTRPNTAYGPGGQPLAFGFRADNLASNGRPGDNPLQNFVFGQPNASGVRGPRNRTNVGDSLFNVNFVFYDPRSLQEPNGNFLEADLALATLDTPTPNRIPTWTLLFSPLTGPTHMTMVGYGRSGDGTTGSSQGIDFRRRSAENIVNALISLDDEDRALGFPTSNLPQDLYMIDFDDPARGTAGRSRFDFDIYRDEALPREGTTAGGDSGSPLIIDQRFTQPVVAGVLSGGGHFSRDAPDSSYGERSFYQPLFLFWDVIVANNPYRYVSANAGDGDWFDATRWVQNMDPAYAVIENGQLRNGLPTTPALGVSGVTPGFGTVCNGQRCTNFNPPPPVNPGSLPAELDTGEGLKLADSDAADQLSLKGPEFVVIEDPLAPDGSSSEPQPDTAQDGPGESPLPNGGTAAPAEPVLQERDTQPHGGSGPEGPAEAAGLENIAPQPRAPAPPPASTPGLRIPGGPGSTNFVPNNVDPNRTTNTRGSYFDVTLSNAGTTTLGGNADAARRSATVDRLTLANTGAVLNITSAGSLTSLIDTTVFSGRINVDGRLATPEFLLAAGLLSGSGTIRTDFLTSAMGVIAPGGVNAVGTLTVDRGSVILASGNQLLIDIGAGGNDLLRVTCARTSAAANAPCAAGSGVVNLGGILGVNLLSGGAVPGFGSTFTFINADGGITGRFSGVADNLPGVLRVTDVTISGSLAQFRVEAGLFSDIVDRNSPISGNFARQLDAARRDPAAVGALRELFTQVDVLEGANLTRAFESLAPYATVTTSHLVRSNQETFDELLHARAHAARKGEGGVQVMGSPLAALQDPMSPPGTMAGDAPQPAPVIATREGVTAFVAGGYVDGEAAALRNTAFAGQQEDLQSYYLSAGVEHAFAPGVFGGLAVSYHNGDGDFGDLSQVEADHLQMGLYGGFGLANGLFFDAQASLGFFDAETTRRPLGSRAFEARDELRGGTGGLGAAAGYEFAVSPLIRLTPTVSLNYNTLQIDRSTEQGGAAVLQVRELDVETLIGRAGVRAAADFDRGAYRLTPHLKVAVASDFIESDPANVEAALQGAPFTSFAGPTRDDLWYEVSAGLGVQGERTGFHLTYSTDIDRDELETRRFNAAFSLRF